MSYLIIIIHKMCVHIISEEEGKREGERGGRDKRQKVLECQSIGLG